MTRVRGGRPERSITVVSYNIHQCVGSDGRSDPGRVAEVLAGLDADIIGLQEVDSRPGPHMESMQMDYLAHVTGMQAIPGPTIQRHTGDYGNVLLIRHRLTQTRRVDLSFPGRERRGAIDVDLDIDGVRLRVIATHLGLHPAERRHQVQRILEILAREHIQFAVLMGDINEWFLWGRPLRWLHARLGRPPALRTFPAIFPVLALDRIWVKPKDCLMDMRTINTPMARMASDHLPLQARIAIDAG